LESTLLRIGRASSKLEIPNFYLTKKTSTEAKIVILSKMIFYFSRIDPSLKDKKFSLLYRNRNKEVIYSKVSEILKKKPIVAPYGARNVSSMVGSSLDFNDTRSMNRNNSNQRIDPVSFKKIGKAYHYH
jgi:hypothetical protein